MILRDIKCRLRNVSHNQIGRLCPILKKEEEKQNFMTMKSIANEEPFNVIIRWFLFGFDEYEFSDWDVLWFGGAD